MGGPWTLQGQDFMSSLKVGSIFPVDSPLQWNEQTNASLKMNKGSFCFADAKAFKLSHNLLQSS